MSTSLNSSVSHSLFALVKTQWATEHQCFTQAHKQRHKTYANHIAPIYMYILGQTHKCTTLHYGPKKVMCKKNIYTFVIFIETPMKLNKVLMKVFEGCLFILLDDIVKYGNAIFTSLVSQIWLKRVCLKAQRQLIGVNEIFHVIKISIQIKADQL